MKRTKETKREIRHLRIRKKVVGSAERPRLTVRKTLKHIYLSVLDDTSRPEGSVAILNVTTNTKAMKASGKKTFCNIKSAQTMGETLGKTLLEKGISQVVFDRAGYPYHGCIKAVAEAVRKAGVTI